MSDLANWRYRARDTQGALQAGSIHAADRRAALAQLQAKGLAVLQLEPAGGAGKTAQGAGRPSRQRRAIRPVERMQLLQELSTLLSAGISLGEAAPSLETAYAHSSLAAPVASLRRAVQAGQGLGPALAASGLGLDASILAMIEAGEAAGHLAQALGDAAQQMQYERQVAEEFKSALIYPAVLVGAGVLAVLGIFTIVVPRFASLLKGRADVPAVSRWVIEGGLYFQQHWLAVSLVSVGLLAALVLALRQPSAQQQLLQLLARLPVAGPWLRETEIGRWATLLSSLLTHRVPLLDAMSLSRKGLRLQADRARLGLLHDELRRGRALSDAMAELHWIAPTRLNLLRVGERSGELPRMLAQLGQLSTETARARMKRLLTLIEPLAILLIGGVIGFIMVAVILAITSLNTAKL